MLWRNVFLLGLSGCVLFFAALFVVMNWCWFIASLVNKRRGIDRYYSTVPLVTLIAAGVAYIIFPYRTKGWIVILPMVDIGNWQLLSLPFVLYREARSANRDE